MTIISLKIGYVLGTGSYVEEFVVGETGLQSIEIQHGNGNMMFFRIVLKYENNNRVMLLPQQTTVIDYNCIIK